MLSLPVSVLPDPLALKLSVAILPRSTGSTGSDRTLVRHFTSHLTRYTCYSLERISVSRFVAYDASVLLVSPSGDAGTLLAVGLYQFVRFKRLMSRLQKFLSHCYNTCLIFSFRTSALPDTTCTSGIQLNYMYDLLPLLTTSGSLLPSADRPSRRAPSFPPFFSHREYETVNPDQDGAVQGQAPIHVKVNKEGHMILDEEKHEPFHGTCLVLSSDTRERTGFDWYRLGSLTD